VHLKRHVRNLGVVRRDREYDDLFQEGCLSLALAASRWDPGCGIPFAAYALPRIHNAISMALRCKFSTVYVPPRLGSKRIRAKDGDSTDPPMPRPRDYSFSQAQWRNLADTATRSASAPEGETVGDRVRDKYERAVRSAVDTLKRRSSVRGDREALLRILVRERLLVPDEDARRSLRQIARETRSSYARVAQSHAQLVEEVKSVLSRDAEFDELLRRARTESDGFATRIDAAVEAALAEAGARSFGRRFARATTEGRGRLIYSLMRRMNLDIDNFVRDGFGRLNPAQREQLLNDSGERKESRVA